MTEAPPDRAPAEIVPCRRFRRLRVYATVARVLLDYGRVFAFSRWRGETRQAELLSACHRRSSRRIRRKKRAASLSEVLKGLPAQGPASRWIAARAWSVKSRPR